MGGGLELDGNVSAFLGEPFARAHIEGHTRPAPVVDRQFERGKGGSCGLCRDMLLLTISADVVPLDRPSAVLPHDAVVLHVEGAYGL